MDEPSAYTVSMSLSIVRAGIVALRKRYHQAESSWCRVNWRCWILNGSATRANGGQTERATTVEIEQMPEDAEQRVM
jgi:hypothetical protein